MADTTLAPGARVTIDAVGFKTSEIGRVIAVSDRARQFTMQVLVETTTGDPGPYLFSAEELEVIADERQPEAA